MMMMRKWMALAGSVSLVALLSAGFSIAAQEPEEEEQPLNELMAEVSAANNRINRIVRSPVTWRKANNGKDVVEYAQTLVTLAKEARERDDAIKKAEDIEDPEKKWKELMDDFIEHSEELLKLAKDEGDQAEAKKVHRSVKKSCADCHKVFRVEDDF